MITLTTPDGSKYLYDFDELTLEQVNSATVLFNLYNEQVHSPPRNVDQMITGGTIELVLRAVSYLVVPVNEDVTDAFKREVIGSVLKSLRAMKSSEYRKLLDIKADFFARAGIVDVESFRQLKPMLDAFAGLNSTQMQNLQSPANEEQTNSVESRDYSTEMNTNAD